jgi:Flp pilus assembly protein TadG
MILGPIKQLATQRGVAAVELAIVIIPMLIMGFGMTEYGRAVYEYNNLAKNVRDAARYLSEQAPGNATAISNAKNLAVYGNTAGTGSALVADLTTAMVSVCDRISCPASNNLQPTGRGVVNLVTVTVSGYSFTPLVTYVMPGNITFGPISATMVQVL